MNAKHLIDTLCEDPSISISPREDTAMERNIQDTVKALALLYNSIDTSYGNVRDAVARGDDQLLGRSLKNLRGELVSLTKDFDQASSKFFSHAKSRSYGVEGDRNER